MEVNAIKLENGEEYIIVDSISNNGNSYLFLANEKNELDVCVRKVIIKENREYLSKLDNDIEFEEVMNLINEKYGKEKNGE